MTEVKQGRRKQYPIDPETFVRAWQTSDTVDEAAAKLEAPRAIVVSRASAYRKAGVNLKRMPRHNPRRLNLVVLNELAQSV